MIRYRVYVSMSMSINININHDICIDRSIEITVSKINK